MRQPTGAAREVELKLHLDPGNAARLRHHPALRAARAGPARIERLAATFWDTPDRALAAAGIGLRLRAEGGRILQTVKTAGAGAGLYDRPEWTTPVPGDSPDAAALAETPAGGVADPANLVPVFTTDFVRAAWPLAGTGWTAEMALDLGVIRAGGATAPVAEVELELTSGPVRPLFDLAQRLNATVPLTLAARDKAEHGYRLAAGAGPAPEKAPRVPLAPATPAGDAFATVARACLRQMVRNAEAILHTGDAEAVHQFRVGTRRLRSAIDTFKPLVNDPESRAIKDRLGDLARACGDARDLDVMLAEVVDPVRPVFRDWPGLESFRATVVRRRNRAYEQARDALRDPAFPALLLETARWIEAGAWRDGPAAPETDDPAEEPVHPFAQRVLKKRFKAVHKTGRDFDALDAAGLHRLRVRVKKLRYATEFFAALFDGNKSAKFHRRLKALQDALGHINDLYQATATAHAVTRATDNPATAEAAGGVAGWCAAGHDTARHDARRAWKAFAKRRPFWK